MNSTSLSPLLLLTSLLLSGCSSVPEEKTSEVEQTNVTNPHPSTFEPKDESGDPLEGFNRVMWSVNYDYLDPYFVRPMSIVYMEWTPSPIRAGFNNFLDNLDEPASAINNLLMGNGKLAMNNFNRFWINTTIGLLGLIDVASMVDIPRTTREFGDVLGHYGVGNGMYMMLPGYGPLTPRDVTDTVDSLYIPLNWLTFWQKATKWTFQGLESRYELIGQEGLLKDSPDSYQLSKSIYLQHQDFKAEIKEEPKEALDEQLLEEYLGHDY
ncbi:MlaA family lipoprotein [Vibrio rumoiensis]|uniref:ABC transporter n=1 Tax=Vibrio rumoiensis 1S-45 TaxID=1188252 RepID=A0A1E5E006_9VIBR|nr:VacJ family lipoprotein [Vibrio rumoiensis]OEF23679.1 ABC transporter [Vibrio rumoiensis 1S-45]